MQCRACGADNTSDRRFCAGCGAPLAVTCTACGFHNQPIARFCGGCGQSLSATGAADAAPPQPKPPPPVPLAGAGVAPRSWPNSGVCARSGKAPVSSPRSRASTPHSGAPTNPTRSPARDVTGDRSGASLQASARLVRPGHGQGPGWRQLRPGARRNARGRGRARPIFLASSLIPSCTDKDP